MINDEQAHQFDVEEQRMRYTLAATNPALYKHIFSRSSESDEEGVIWTTPQTPEEVDELLALMNETFTDQDA